MVTVPLADAPAGIDAANWDAACAAVRAFCDWHVAPNVQETVTVDGPGGRFVVLPTAYLTGLTSITNDGNAVSTPRWSRSGKVSGAWWSCEFGSIVAEIQHGYDECPVEILPILKSLALSMAGASAASTVKQQTAGPFTTVYSDAVLAGGSVFTDMQKSVLNRYRRIPIS